MQNPSGYLYRVGQSAARHYAVSQLPLDRSESAASPAPEFEPGLSAAIDDLSEQQRAVVLLVHGFEWRKSEVARHLDISESTVSEHLRRAIANIRDFLEVQNA